MAERLSADDVRQQYLHNLVFYKDSPVRVDAVKSADVVWIWDIKTQTHIDVNFNLKDFKAPTLRMGMMNLCDSVVYVSRMPLRKMNIGLSSYNIVINTLDVNYPEGTVNTKDSVRDLCHPSFIDMYLNKYPNLEEAIQISKKFESACAFDKQFAIDVNRKIYYKTYCVGTLPKELVNIKDIKFNPQYSHLSILLEGNHEKTITIACL